MQADDTIASLGSLEAWRRAVSLATGALRCRWMSVLALTVLFTAIGAAAAALLPRTYSAESRLLIKKNFVMPALAHPKRAVPLGSEAPAQSAAEFVLNREALQGIADRLRLVDRWDAERAPVLRAKDRLSVWIKGPVPTEEKVDAIVDMLAARLRVQVQDDVLRVRVTWGDRQTVVDIVNAGVETFLEARRRIDVQTIADTSRILATFAERERARMEAHLAAVVDARRAAPKPSLGPVTASRPREPLARAADSETSIAMRQRAIDARKLRLDLERRHSEQVAQIEARIADRLATRTERHPEIQSLRGALERASEEPTELAEARREEARLVSDYLAQGGTAGSLENLTADGDPAAASAPAGSGDPAAPGRLQDSDVLAALAAADRTDEDDATTYQQSLLKNSIETYQDLQARLANAQIELETAQAAFAYRYSVLNPARRPKEADSPNVALILVGGFMAGLFAGVLTAVFAELRSQALLSPTALGRHLGLADAA